MDTTTPTSDGERRTTMNDTDTGSVQETTITSESETSGKMILFFILFFVGVFSMVFIVFAFAKAKRNRSASQEDLEAQASGRDGLKRGQFLRGTLIFIPLCLAVIAFALSVVTNTSCRFLSFSEDRSGELDTAGLWSVAYLGESSCSLSFPESFEFDSAFTLTRVSAVLASTFGGIGMLALLYASVGVSVQTLSVRWVALPLAIAVLFQCLTFAYLETDRCVNNRGCSLGDDAGFPMLAAFYWFVAALSTYLVAMKESSISVRN